MIPKIIHYCWVGNAPKPKSVLYCIESWKKFCPDYEIREWNESNYDFTKNKYMKQAYEAKKWGFVPDYARLDIIYEYGGIYLDTDVEIIRSFDELLDQEAFMGFEETGEKTYYVNCGQGFGAVPHHEIIKKARDLYEHISFYKEDGTLNMLASPHYTTQTLKEYGLLQENKDQNLRSMKIYASDVLCPKNFRTGKIHESNRTVSIHHFTASWLDEKIKKEIKRRQKLERVMGKGGTNKFLYIESVLQKYAGLKMFTKLPLRAKEKLKKRIIKIVEVVPDYKELILASFFKSDKKKIVLLDPSYDGDNTGDQIIVENCKKYFPLTKKENIIYVPTHRKLMNKEIRELSGATIKVLCGTNALSGHMRTYGLWRMEKKVRIYNNTILMGVGFECNNQEYDYYTKMLLHTILHKKYIHSVRDSFSEQMLNSMGITNVINTGCPTMWGITKELCQDIPKRKAQEVICTLTDYDRDLENDQKLLDILLLCYKKIYLWPQGIEDEEYYKELRIDSKIVKIPFGLENYDSLLEHKEIDYVGTRLHAGIRAIGKRHRTIVIAIDNRAKNIANDTGLPIVLRENIGNLLKEKIESNFETDIQMPWDEIEKWKNQFKGGKF